MVPHNVRWLRARIMSEREDGPSEIVEVLNDEFEELTGTRT